MDSNLSSYVESAMHGDSSAFEEIYRQTYHTVYYTCLNLLKNEQDAADTTQEVYITALNSLSALKDKEKFLPWLSRIAVNKCKNILLQNKPVTVDMDTAENVIQEDNENFLPEEYITNKEKRQIVMKIIRTCLSDVQYRTVFLHYFNGFSVSEIAEIMECPVGTVTYRLSTARGRIKQAVDKYEKHNNEKLYSVAVVPLLACIFAEAFKEFCLAAPLPAEPAGSPSANTIIKETAKKGTRIMLKTLKAKIIAIIAGIIIAGGIVASVIVINANKRQSTAKTPKTADGTTTEVSDSVSPEETQNEEDTSAGSNASSQARNLDIKLEIVGEFDDGLAPVKEKRKGNWGFIDTQGNLVIDYQYSYIYSFSEGLACAQKSDGGLYGFIDTSGNVVIPFEYSHVNYFSEGVVHVVYGSHGYILDKTGAVLATTDYESSGICSEGLISVRKDDKWGFIDKEGNLVIDCQYDVVSEFSEGLAWVRKDDKSGYIDATGNTVIDFIYDYDYHNSSTFTGGYAVVAKDKKYGLIDTKGNVIIDFAYDRMGSYTEDGLIYAEKDGFFGYIDLDGNTVIPFQYDDANDFYDGLAYVSMDGKYGFIDTKGNVVIDFLYDDNYTPRKYCFVDGITPMILNGQGCYIDKSGNVVIGKVE